MHHTQRKNKIKHVNSFYKSTYAYLNIAFGSTRVSAWEGELYVDELGSLKGSPCTGIKGYIYVNTTIQSRLGSFDSFTYKWVNFGKFLSPTGQTSTTKEIG